MTPKVIGLDVDGVLTIAGEAAKQEGWKMLLPELVANGHPATLPEVFAEQEKKYTGGNSVVKGDRYDILWGMWRALNYSGDRACDLVKESASRYDEITRQLIVKSGVHEKTHEALRRWQKMGIPYYAVSATPQDALVKTMRELKLMGFKDILGFPKKKPAHLRDIMAIERVSPNELLFVGDSPGDHKAAQEVACGFIGVGNNFNGWSIASQPFPVVQYLTEIDSIVGL